MKSRRGNLEPTGSILRSTHPDLVVSKQKLRRAEVIELVREKRESGNQALGFASRPFVLCGLPVKRPRPGVLLHERRNGRFLLQVTGHPSYGLPWGQDRLVPLYLATLAVRQQSETITFHSGVVGSGTNDVAGVPSEGERRRSGAPAQPCAGDSV